MLTFNLNMNIMKSRIILIFSFLFSFVTANAQDKDYIQLINASTSSTIYKTFISSFSESPEYKSHEDDYNYVSFYQSGIEILIRAGKVHTIYFHNQRQEKFKSYKGKLPKGIYYGMPKSIVYDKLKTPSKSGGGGEFLGKAVPYWDKWIYANYSLHLTYNANNEVVEVTLMTNN